MANDDLLIGKQISNYRILAKINSGSFGSVYRGKHVIFEDDQIVAIKLLHTVLRSQQEHDEFIKEAQILKKLNHPHILRILDAGFQDGIPYIITEYASGGSLRDRMKQSNRKPLPLDEAISVLTQIGQALHYAHAQHIIHRDLKPENILFHQTGEAVLADFGIATLLASTRTGQVGFGGTPPYMAPEQFEGKVSTKSDQYSLSCIAYELVTGHRLFNIPNPSLEAYWYHHAKVEIIPPRQLNPQLPARIEQAIIKALAKDRVQRHSDVFAFCNALLKNMEEWIQEGNDHFNVKHYEEAITAYDQAIRLNPNYAFPYFSKGNALYNLKRYEEALFAYNQAIRLDSSYMEAHYKIGKALENLKRPWEALSAYRQAVHLNPSNHLAYNDMIKLLHNLESTSHQEASVTTPALISKPKRTKSKSFIKRILPSRQDNEPSKIDSEDVIDNQKQRNLYTALYIGAVSIVAVIFEMQEDGIGEVLGVGRNQQSYTHISDGMVIDIAGEVVNCNEALIKAEKSAGGLIAPATIISIWGELVKGSSITVSRQRPDPNKEITPEELESAISSAQTKLYKMAKERIATETGYSNIEVRLVHSAVTSTNVDGFRVDNPIGYRGRHFQLTVFSAFAPLAQLGALETVTKALDLTLISVVPESYALARCLSVDAGPDSGAIFIDISGGTTDIALIRQGGIEDTRMFALGERTFTQRLASSKGLSIKETENLEILYSTGNLEETERDEVRRFLAPEVQTWLDNIELLVDELAKGKLLPPAIYLVGGGSALPFLRERLESFPWKDRLPFSRNPLIEIVQPSMVSTISDPRGLLQNTQDIIPMALAYQAIELQDETNVLERALNRVIYRMHIKSGNSGQ